MYTIGVLVILCACLRTKFFTVYSLLHSNNGLSLQAENQMKTNCIPLVSKHYKTLCHIPCTGSADYSKWTMNVLVQLHGLETQDGN